MPTSNAETTLYLRHTFAAPREKVFRAWTTAAELKRWFAAGADYVGELAEVDLRVGGKYRIGMKYLPDGTLHVATGIYKVIKAPERLVFTWSWEGQPDRGETLVSIEFHEHGTSTEVVFTHELFLSPELRDRHMHGWQGCFDRLARVLTG